MLSENDLFFAYLNRIQQENVFYGCLVIVNLGLIGNMLNMLTFALKRKRFARNTMGFYNMLTSALNILSLVFAYLYYFPTSAGMPNLLLVSNLSCIALSFLLRVVFQTSSWISVMTTLDRMICINFPRRFKFITDTHKLSWVAFSICILISIWNIPNFFFKLETNSITNIATNKTEAVRQCTANTKLVSIRDLMGVCIRFMVPFALEFVLNTTLIYNLITVRKRMSLKRDMTREYKFALTIAVLNVLHFIADLPTFVITVYMSAMGYNLRNVPVTRSEAVMNVAYSISLVLSSFRYICLFYVNLLLNKLFRRELFNILIIRKVNLNLVP